MPWIDSTVRRAGLTALLAALCLAGRVAFSASAEIGSFARAPALALPTLSPDGTFIGYVEQDQDLQFIVLRNLASGSSQRVLELQSSRERVRWCGWADVRHLLCGTVVPVRRQDAVFERTRLHVIDAPTRTARELNARLPDPLHDQVIDLLPARAKHVLLQHDPTGRGFPEVSELDVTTGALRGLVRSRPPVRRWISDPRGQVRLGVGYDAGVASLSVRGGFNTDWRILVEQALADPDAIGPLAFGAGPFDLYALKHHVGRAALFHIDVRDGKATLLFGDPLYDVAGPVITEPGTGKLLAVRYVADEPRTHYFDSAEAALQASVDELLPGRVNMLIDRTLDGRTRLVHSASDVDAPSIYVFDAQPRRLTLVGHQYPKLEGNALAPMRSLFYSARDGQRIPAYLSLPPSPASSKLPAVVLPHGGPEARDVRGFDPLVQFLAARGYAVLQMNFRGSLGYGARFAAAGAGQWGGLVHNDITDGARWLIEQGIADPARICIVGRSFGGYAALLAATRESQWYACAASYAAPTDLMALAEYTQRTEAAEIWRDRLGRDSHALWQMSPMSRVNMVGTPVLMIHGRTDPVVPIRQARRFARELREAGKEHLFLERPDCDHDMTIESCRLAFYTELDRFLADALQATRQ